MKSTYTAASQKLIHKFWVLYILNCTDILFTYTFLKTGDFYEANPIMRSIVTNPYLCLLVKVLCPGIALVFLFHFLERSTKELSVFCQWMANFILLIYVIINSLHLYYLFALLH